MYDQDHTTISISKKNLGEFYKLRFTLSAEVRRPVGNDEFFNILISSYFKNVQDKEKPLNIDNFPAKKEFAPLTRYNRRKKKEG